MKIVMANGCFDLLHAGHVAHLREARSFGDRLIVALTVDESINKGHGRPIFPWEQRAEILRELRSVDEVVPTATSVDAIHKHRPHIFVKGIDYAGRGFTEDVASACKEVGAELRFTYTPKMSSTAFIQKAERARMSVMWEKTQESLPPKAEVLAVIHRVKGPTGGEIHEEAVWTGVEWKRRRDGAVVPSHYYSQWRRLTT